MQPSNQQHETPTHVPPATQPAELQGPSEPAAAQRASAFALAWNNLRSAAWVKRIADSAAVRGVLSTVKKALDDTQARSQHDENKRP